MNKRIYGILPDVPEYYKPILPMLGRKRKPPAKSIPVGCARCKARLVTLRKDSEGQFLCSKCYERGSKR